MKNKIMIVRIIIGIIFWVLGIIFIDNNYLSLGFFIIGYLVSGYDILFKACKNIINLSLLDEFFLMAIASIGAFFLGEYIEACAVMIFFQIGEFFQGIAVNRSRNAIMKAMDLTVKGCWLADGTKIDPLDVEVGMHILVKPMEMVPIDGRALGCGVINCASLTGEPLDIEVNANDIVLSGSINSNTPLIIETTKLYYDSTATRILDMVENATMNKAKSERFITKFARIYTPVVVGVAFMLAFLVPLFLGFNEHFSTWLYRALSFLVVSCPCALVISVPLSYFAGIGRAARNKIIIKGGSYLEDLALADTVILDKTGTLTRAEFEISKIIGEQEGLRIAKGLERLSTHPIAKAINKYDIDYYEFTIEEEAGYGVIGYRDNIRYICGSLRLLEKYNIKPILCDDAGTRLYVCRDDKCITVIILNDSIKDEALKSINELRGLNQNIILLSGDNENSVANVCNKLGIDSYYAGLLPADKVDITKNIINNSSGKVLFVGDGINDAPVLAISDIGVSMGQIGSDSAIEASDVVILNDNLEALPKMLRISKKTRRIVIENIIFAIGVKFLVLVLCAFGLVGMDWAIFADVGVCVIAIINAMRALRGK